MDVKLRQRMTRLRSSDSALFSGDPHAQALWQTLTSLERLADLHAGLEEVIDAALYVLESYGAYRPSEHPYAWL